MRKKQYSVIVGAAIMNFDSIQSLHRTPFERNIIFSTKFLQKEEAANYSSLVSKSGGKNLFGIQIKSLEWGKPDKYITPTLIVKAVLQLKKRFGERFVVSPEAIEAEEWRLPHLDEIPLIDYVGNTAHLDLGTAAIDSYRFNSLKARLNREVRVDLRRNYSFVPNRSTLTVVTDSSYLSPQEITQCLLLCGEHCANTFVPSASLFEYEHVPDSVRLARYKRGPVGGILYDGDVKRLYETDNPQTLWVGEGLSYPSTIEISDYVGKLQPKILASNIETNLLNKHYGDRARGVIYTQANVLVLLDNGTAEVRSKTEQTIRTQDIVYIRMI